MAKSENDLSLAKNRRTHLAGQRAYRSDQTPVDPPPARAIKKGRVRAPARKPK